MAVGSRLASRLLHLSGLLVVPVIALAFVLAGRAGLHPAGAVLVLLLGVGYATLVGGRPGGLIAALVALAFGAWYESDPGQPFAYTRFDIERLVAFALALPVTVLTLSHIRARLNELLVTERRMRLIGEREQERTRRIVESITDVFFALDRDWRYTYVNKQAEQLVGRPRADLLGRTLWEAFPPLVGSIWDREYHRAMADGTPVSFEAYYPPFGVWLETHAYPSEEGGITIYIRDVTADHRAREDLAKRARQQALVARLGLAAVERHSIEALAGEAAAATAEGMGVELAKVLQLLPDGRALRLITGVGWNEGTVGQTLVPAQFGSQAGFTLEKREPIIVPDLARETRFAAPSLLVDHAVASGVSVAIGTGVRPWGILGAHSRRVRMYSKQDVHFLQGIAHVLAAAIERERAHEDLRRSQELFFQLAENLGEVLFVADQSRSRIEYVNPAYERVWGRSRQSLYEVSRSWLNSIHPEDRPRAEQAMVLLQQGQEYDEEFRIERPDGGIRWIRERLFAVGGDTARVVGLAEDVTLRHREEENRRRMLEETSARRAAEARAQARDEVLAMVAHDLRSPLATIRTTTHLIKRQGSLDERSRNQMAIVERATDRAARLLSDLLDVSRIEAGVFTANLQTEAPASLLEGACEAIHAQLDEAGLRVVCEKRSGLPPVLAERDRILQVLLNLLGNALKFTPRGGRIEARIDRCDEGVLFSVSNTGTLPEEALPHLFERFWQARPQDRRGTGLGLAIARGIVEAHGGRIWADVANGRTTFRFTLRSSIGSAAHARNSAPQEGSRGAWTGRDPETGSPA